LSEKGINPGEAEVFAQNQALGSGNILLIDETNARKLALKLELTFNGVLFVIATMDIKFSICNYSQVVSKLKSEFGFSLTDKIIRKAFQKTKDFHMNNSI
jgi:predicted nucleic acid-binding protein